MSDDQNPPQRSFIQTCDWITLFQTCSAFCRGDARKRKGGRKIYKAPFWLGNTVLGIKLFYVSSPSTIPLEI